MRLVKIFLLIFVLHILANHAFACRCKDTMSTFQEYLSSDIVFVGKAIKFQDSLHHKEVTFEVSQNIKHVYKKSITLKVGHSSCDFNFKNDSIYLVYAHIDKHGNIHTTICSRTKLFSAASNELKELHSHDDMDCKVLLPVETAEKCSEIYEPVCGCDGQTYGNPCIAHNNGVNHWIFGECRKIQK